MRSRWMEVWCRCLFQAWKIVLTERVLVGQMAEVESLKKKLGKKSDSIWNMNKAELSEIARKELGMNAAKAEKETVITLREKIKNSREVTKVALDPMCQLPKGLNRMKLEELLEEMKKRELPIPPKATRPVLMVAIRDDVDARILLSAPTAKEALVTDEDYEMVGSNTRSRSSRRPGPSLTARPTLIWKSEGVPGHEYKHPGPLWEGYPKTPDPSYKKGK